jgi:hypothetical protein
VALKEAFLDLFGIACAKDASVAGSLGVLWWFQSVECEALLERLMIGRWMSLPHSSGVVFS